MKKFWIILAIVLPLGFIIGLIIWGKDIWDKITFTPYFVKADLKGLSMDDIQPLLNGEERTIEAILGMEIKNDSNSSVTITGLKAKLFYKGTPLAETSESLAERKYVIEANNVNNPLQITDNVTIRLNKAGAQLLIDKFTGKKPRIDYTIDLSVLGIPVGKFLRALGFSKDLYFEW